MVWAVKASRFLAIFWGKGLEKIQLMLFLWSQKWLYPVSHHPRPLLFNPTREGADRNLPPHHQSALILIGKDLWG